MTANAHHLAIITSPTPGHLNPLQVLGAALAERGCRVTIVHVAAAARYVSDGSVGFAALSDQAGGDEAFDAFLGKLARPTGIVGTRRMIQATAALTGALLDGAPEVLERIGADAVIADTVEPAGALIAQRLGLPYATSITGLPLLREEDVPPPFLGWRFRPDALGRFRNRGGYAVSDWLMRPSTRLMEDRRRSWGLTASRQEPCVQIAQCPPGFDYPRKELPTTFRYGSRWRYAAATEIALPDDGRPLVFCSLGTLQGARWSLFAKMARACASIGARAVIGHGGSLSSAEETALPGDALVDAFWPQEAVLRQCAAAVLHGGFNSVLDALAEGVPIVALPIAFEQAATAARLAWTGAGKVLSPRFLSTRSLAAALAEVMDRPSFRGAAARLGTELAAADGVVRAAEALNVGLGLSLRPQSGTVAIAA